MASYENPAAIKILQLDIIKFDGSNRLSLLGQAYQMDIYESIFSPVIHFELLLSDPVDLKNTYPMIGEEFVEVEFYTPGYEGKPTRFKFVVSSVEQVQYAPNNSGKTFVIKGNSEEILYDTFSLVNRRYQGIEIHQMVKSICKEYLKTSKEVLVERTLGVQDLLIVKKRAFQVIDMLRMRASSAKGNLSEAFVFFENRYGFNFITIEQLFDTNKKNIGDRRFFFDTAVNSDLRNINFRNALAIENASSVNSLMKIQQGGFINRVYKYDFFTGEKSEVKTKFAEKFEKFKSPNDNPASISTQAFMEKVVKKPTKTVLVPVDGSRPETHVAESVGIEHLFMNMLSQNIFRMRIYGDSIITTGDVIELNLPKTTAYSKSKTADDNLQSGNYLISKVRHNIMFGSKQEYYNSLEILNGSFVVRG